jgi:hypothetical protein
VLARFRLFEEGIKPRGFSQSEAMTGVDWSSTTLSFIHNNPSATSPTSGAAGFLMPNPNEPESNEQELVEVLAFCIGPLPG